MKRRYILKNKRRFATVLILFSLIVFSAGLIVTAGAASNQENNYNIFEVSHGDTLWEIALAHSNNSDIRAYIYEIKTINHLDGDDIYAGQELYLP